MLDQQTEAELLASLGLNSDAEAAFRNLDQAVRTRNRRRGMIALVVLACVLLYFWQYVLIVLLNLGYALFIILITLPLLPFLPYMIGLQAAGRR